jgi:hypothetical protein
MRASQACHRRHARSHSPRSNSPLFPFTASGISQRIFLLVGYRPELLMRQTDALQQLLEAEVGLETVDARIGI